MFTFGTRVIQQFMQLKVGLFNSKSKLFNSQAKLDNSKKARSFNTKSRLTFFGLFLLSCCHTLWISRKVAKQRITVRFLVQYS